MTRARRTAWIAAAIAAGVATAGCQGGDDGDAPAPAPAHDAAAAVAAGGDAGADTSPDELAEPPVGSTAPGDDDDEPADDATAESLGAVPAWHAVVERDQYLARRGQRGIVHGVVGEAVPPPAPATPPAPLADGGMPPPPPPTGLTWLIDDTEGAGALGIRVRFGEAPPPPGTRVAVGGAWVVEDGWWTWRADGITTLPAGPDDDARPPARMPGLAIATVAPPGKRVTADKAARGDLVEFTVVATPRQVGDGWTVSDRKWGTPMAVVRLPGERVSYGGHDLRGADEVWPLKKGGTYWVKAGRVRKRDGELPVIDAVTPPARAP